MKVFRICVLQLTAILLFSEAGAQTVLFRHSGASFANYKTALLSASFRQSPADELERRLKTDELPLPLQRELETVLQTAAQTSAQAAFLFEDFYRKLEQEPRSTAVRETMRSLLERLLPESTAERRRFLRIQIEMLEALQAPSAELKLQSSLLQREIQARLLSLQRFPGGEDVVLFWNGVRWNERLSVTNEQSSQWILISSQWKPRLFTGTWSEVSGKIGTDFSDWVTGTCDEPVYQDALFVPENQRETLFDSDCIADRAHFQPTASPVESRTSTSFYETWKPVIWTGLAATVVAMIISTGGKKIQVHR